MINYKLSGLSEVLAMLDAEKLMPYSAIDKIVQNNSQPLVNQIKQNYISAGHNKTGDLVKSILAFKRKRKGKNDPYFTYYVGPKYGKGGGNHAHFLEYGVLFSAYPVQGQGKSISGRKYGKYSTKQGFRIKSTGVIRKSKDQKEQSIISGMEKGLIDLILNEAKRKGFKI
jgi:hypothetical protein